jgi:hypothetical protein
MAVMLRFTGSRMGGSGLVGWPACRALATADSWLGSKGSTMPLPFCVSSGSLAASSAMRDASTRTPTRCPLLTWPYWSSSRTGSAGLAARHL